MRKEGGWMAEGVKESAGKKSSVTLKKSSRGVVRLQRASQWNTNPLRG